MAIDSDFNSRNPNGIINSNDTSSAAINSELSRKGARIFRELDTKEITVEVSTKGLINAEKELKELEEYSRRVSERIATATEEDKKALEEYKKELDKSYREQEARLEKSKAAYREKYGKDIESEKQILELAKAREKKEAEIQERLESIALQKKNILADEEKSLEQKRKEIKELDKQESEEKYKLSKARGETPEDVVKALGENLNGPLGSIFSRISESSDSFNSYVEEKLDEITDNHPLLGDMRTMIGMTKKISDSIVALRATMGKAINSAVASMTNYYGRINANLENSIYSSKYINKVGEKAFDTISDNAASAMGISPLIKQTDYLNEIANLSNQGLVTNIEQRALLETIKDKTLTSFNATNAGILKLIRLGEQNTTAFQFGVELQLKRLLNSPIFGDSSYLQGMFDSVASAIVDASIVGRSDITNFNSTVQTWLGAMYSSGLSDNVVSSIATGINALGTGNVSALAQDESIQRLFLLSMDRIGMDYADVLQQGLSSEDTNNLLASIIQYLDEISTNTSDNLVLKSSYSNLFNLSMSDMQAIHNVSSKLGDITSNIISSSEASSITSHAISELVSVNTLTAEKWNTFFDNLSYSFGSNIADNSILYSTYKISDLTYDLFNQFGDVGGGVGRVAKVGKTAAAAVQLAIGTIGLIDALTGQDSVVGSYNSSSLLSLLGSVQTSGGTTYTTTTSESSAESPFKTLRTASKESYMADITAWSEEEDDKALGILQELAKTLMKEKSGNYAFAVSLQGMSDEVLKSFASIFADEDAMLATFKGDNKVLKDALFGYLDDTTSNSTSNNNSNTTNA